VVFQDEHLQGLQLFLTESTFGDLPADHAAGFTRVVADVIEVHDAGRHLGESREDVR